MKKSIFFVGASLLFVAQIAVADDPKHLYEATQADPALKASFAKIVEPVVKESPWVSDYGTTAPPVDESIDDIAYQIYWGCKPKDCISESYTVAYDPAKKEVVAGAFVRSSFDGPHVQKSEITWLGQTDWDLAKLIGKYLY